MNIEKGPIPEPKEDLDNVGLIAHKLDFIDKAWQHLSETHGLLFDRLNPVLSPDFPHDPTPTDKSLDDTPSRSEVVTRLDDITDRMYRLSNELTHIMNRLES